MRTFGPAKPSRLKAIKVRGGFTNRAPSMRVSSVRKPKLIIKGYSDPLDWKTSYIEGQQHHFAKIGKTGGTGIHVMPVGPSEGGGFKYAVKVQDTSNLAPRHVANVSADSEEEAADHAKNVATSYYNGSWRPESPIAPSHVDKRVSAAPAPVTPVSGFRSLMSKVKNKLSKPSAPAVPKAAAPMPSMPERYQNPSGPVTRPSGPVVSKRPLSSATLKGMPNGTILHAAAEVNGSRTQVPAMRLYLDMDPYSDHHGHGFWAGKFDIDKKQVDYEPDDQDMGRPNLSVAHHFDSATEVEDETIKSFRVSPTERLSLNLRGKEPQALRQLRRRNSGVRSKANFKVLGRFHRHPSVIIRTKRKMPQTKPHIFRRMRRVRAPR